MVDPKTVIPFARALRARLGLLAVETPEPARLLEALRLAAENPYFPEPRPSGVRPFRLVVFSPTQGFVEEAVPGAGGGALFEPGEAGPDTRDPLAALEAVLRAVRRAGADQVLWVLPLGREEQAALQAAPAQACLWELAALTKRVRHTVLFWAPLLELPQEVERVIYRREFPLPGEQELRALVAAFFEAAGRRGRQPDPETLAVLARGLKGLTYDEADAALAEAYIAAAAEGGGLAALPRHLVRAKAELVRRVPALEFVEPVDLGEIGGLDNLKAFARLLRAAFTERARSWGLRPPRGILLVGVPGTGKSLAARALAGELPIFRLDMGAVFGPLVGQSEANLRAALRTLEAAAPAVAWLDELEKAASTSDLDGGTSLRVLGTLLTWMQERAQAAGVVVIATANEVARLRPELIDRFTYRFFVDLPGPRARAEILAIHLRKRGFELPPEALQAAARAARGHSGRSLEAAVEAALLELAAAGEAGAGAAGLFEALLGALGRVRTLVQQDPEGVEAIRRLKDRFDPAQDPAADPEEPASPAAAEGGAKLF